MHEGSISDIAARLGRMPLYSDEHHLRQEVAMPPLGSRRR